MKKNILKMLSAAILLIGAFMVLGGCEGNKYPITLDFTLIGKSTMRGNES